MELGFLGLGIMGKAVSINLLHHGFKINVWNRTLSKLCKIAAGQRYSKKLNGRQVNALLRATCQRPYFREKDIRGMSRRNNFNRDELVQEFGIKEAGFV